MKDALVDLYEELHQDVKEITGIESGYTSLNKMTCGLQEGDFVVLGARPSMGEDCVCTRCWTACGEVWSGGWIVFVRDE